MKLIIEGTEEEIKNMLQASTGSEEHEDIVTMAVKDLRNFDL